MRYMQKKFANFLQCTKSQKKNFGIFYIFDKKYDKTKTIQDKLVLFFLAGSCASGLYSNARLRMIV